MSESTYQGLPHSLVFYKCRVGNIQVFVQTSIGTSDILYVYSPWIVFSCSLNSLPAIQDCEIKIPHSAHSTVYLNL